MPTASSNGRSCWRHSRRSLSLDLSHSLESSSSRRTDRLKCSVQVNTIATVFLCAMLVPLLKRAAKLPVPTGSASATSLFSPHLTIVSSGAHLSLGELEGLEDGTIFQRANLPENHANAAGGNMTYARSKGKRTIFGSAPPHRGHNA